MSVNAFTENQTGSLVSLVLNSWVSRNKAVTDFFNQYPEELYMTEVAPGRNRAVYLLGHLIAANDGMLPLFGLGDRIYPHLEFIFSKSPDKAVEKIPSLAELKDLWLKANEIILRKFMTLSSEQWLDRHTAVSPEDFVKEPHRNKINALMGRTNHISYHLGQLNFLPSR